jgi:SAM-dependent methyltransferase
MHAPNQYFETSFGDHIAIQPGVERRLYPDSASEEKFKRGIETSFASETFLAKQIVNKTEIDDVTSDLNTFSLVIDFLEELRLLEREYDTALDIAGCNGIHAALLRGNYVKHVEVADVADGTDPHLTRKLKRGLWKHRLYKIEDFLTGGGFGKHRVKRVNNNKHVNLPSFKNYYNFSFKRTPKVDRFIVGDWRSTAIGRYDFIMNFMCFWLWDHKQSLEKIASSLNPGGIFVTLAPYCWAGRGLGDGGCLLGGDFPFFDQRLSLVDIRRYYEQFKPHLAQYVDKVWHFFDPYRPTLNNYIDSARDAGLVVLGSKRLYNSTPNVALTYKERFGDKIVYGRTDKNPVIADAGEILTNIHRFRQDVTFEDLVTRGVILVVQKPS